MAQIGGDGVWNFSLQQQGGGQIGVVGADVRQPGPGGHQVRRRTQAGGQFKIMSHGLFTVFPGGR